MLEETGLPYELHPVNILEDDDYIAGVYSIADIALFTWILSYVESDGDLSEFNHPAHWLDRVGQRPAVQRGLNVLAEKRKKIEHSKKEREILFGQTQLTQGFGRGSP